MSHLPLSQIGRTPFEKLMGYTPEILKHWSKLETAFFQSQTFEPHFLEQIRRTLAYENLCQYCMTKAGPPDENPSDNKLHAALRFANKLAINHRSIDEEEIQLLKTCFSLEEISELISFCCFISASQRFGAVLGLQSAETYP